jgi:glycine/sarcosine N-methyltransferase
MNNTEIYDALGSDYDAMVDWGARLKREWPFFQQTFHQVAAARVLDVGCGTGGHAIFFARQGLEVTGADPSAAMLRQATLNATGVSKAHFIGAGFGELVAKIDGHFDAITCLGNTLPHILSRDALQDALADIADGLRPGGVFIVQQLNYDRIMSSRQRYLGLSAGERKGREILFLRFYDFGPELLTFNLVTINHGANGWTFSPHSTPLRPILRQELTDLLQAVGFDQIECFGDYERNPFVLPESNDLVLVARKKSEG